MARITQQLVNSLVTKTRVAKLVYDDGVPGFCVRLTPRADGKTIATYAFDYYFKRDKRRRTIGRAAAQTADEARKKAREWRTLIDKKDNKIDPLKALDEWKNEQTFEKLADTWLVDATERQKPKRASSLRNDRRMLKKIILPAFGAKRLSEITHSDIKRLHRSLKAKKYSANRVLALVKTIFNYGVHQELCIVNPAQGVEKFKEDERERFLTVEELQRFREALDKYKDQSAANALRLLLLTGAREGEVLRATWEEFNLQNGRWTKPSHHTKTDTVEHIPLSAPTLKLLEAMYYEGAHGPLFPGKESGARVTIRRPWVQACKAAGLVKEYLIDGKRNGEDGEPVKLTRYRPTLRIHDLRHNFASHLASSGVSLQVVGKLLGHTRVQTTARYSYLQDEALRTATNKFGDIFEPQAPKAAKRRA